MTRPQQAPHAAHNPEMADVTKAIRGYGADTREYAANTRIDIHAPNSVCRVYASSRAISKIMKVHTKFTNTRIGYSPIRGHTRTFAQVHRDVCMYVCIYSTIHSGLLVRFRA